MRNIALYYFSGIDISQASFTDGVRIHFIDPYILQGSDWEKPGHGSSRVAWAVLEHSSKVAFSKVIDIAMPNLNKTNREALRFEILNCELEIKNLDQALFTAQRTLIGQMSTTEIISLANRLFRFWAAYLKVFKIDQLICTVIPHSFTDYLLVDACVSLGIPVICPTASGMSRSCQYVEYGSSKILRRNVNDLAYDQIDDIDEFIQNNSPTNLGSSMGYTKEFRAVASNRVSEYKRFLLSFSDSATQILNYKVALTRKYDDLCRAKPIPDSFDNRNIIFLHYQPESSSTPQGKKYADQKELVKKVVSQSLERDIIIIKEHPNQFIRCGIMESTYDHIKNVLEFRTSGFYEYVTSIENCYLCPRSISATKLLNAGDSTVWSLCGTVSLQAFLKGIKLGELNTISPYRGLIDHNDLSLTDRSSFLRDYFLSNTWHRFRRDNEVLVDNSKCVDLINNLINSLP